MMENKNILSHHDRLAEMLNDCSIDRIMAIDTSWNIIAWNSASEQASGIPKKDILGKNLLEVFPLINNDKEMLNAIHLAFMGQKSFVPSDKKQPHRQYYENHFIPLKDDDKEILVVMNIMHDVAHRIKAEKQLQAMHAALEKKYRQLEMLTDELATFTYITGRDIKEPLKYVYTSFELLIKSEVQNLSNNSKARIRKMQGSLNRMNLLLDDILLLSRVSSARLSLAEVDCNRLLQEVIDGMEKKIIDRQVEINATRLPVITGDRDMLRHLFSQLLGNAIKFQPQGNKPRVTITGDRVSVINDRYGDTEPRDYYKISFTDNGIGFDQGDAGKIFGLFEQLHERTVYGGSGIGLTVCKKIAEVHEGFIEAEGHPGKGAAFHCYFPVSPEA